MNIRDARGNCGIVVLITTVLIIILSFTLLPKFIDSLSKYDIPVKDGDYLIYDFSRGSGSNIEHDTVKFQFSIPQKKQLTIRVTSLISGQSREAAIKTSVKFEDQMGEFFLKGTAPVWYPKNRLGKGGNIRGHRILENTLWKGWDVWVAGEPKLKAMYYERSTGFLVGFEFIIPETASAVLVDTNIEELQKE